MLPAIGLVAVLAAQPPAPARSPYLDVVRGFRRETAEDAITSLAALRLRAPDDVLDHLDRRVCASVGARGCSWWQRQAAGFDVAGRVQAAWRILYPRALALHVVALSACDPQTGQDDMELHRVIVLALIQRIEQIAAEPGMPSGFAAHATRGRHLLVWVLQFLRHEPALASTLQWFDAAKVKIHDTELALARGALEELRALPHIVRTSRNVTRFDAPLPRDARIAAEEGRHVSAAVRAYEQLLAREPGVIEAHLRLARLLLRQGRPAAAEPHVRRAAALDPDGRQTYLLQMFLADALERRDDRAGALAAYAAAKAAWPTAQSPDIGTARLHALTGDAAAAGAALARLNATRALDARSDPWHGYTGAQSWKLPAGLQAAEEAFEPLR